MAARNARRWALVLCCSSVAACVKSAPPTFLEQKTGIVLAERAECGSSLTGNERCAPERFGAAVWEKNAALPPYSVSEQAVRLGARAVVAEVRLHYIGSPFYDNDVHVVCKSELSESALPSTGTSMQDYDLGAALQDRAVRPVTMEFLSVLESKGVASAHELARRFGARLKLEVQQRVQARVLWFETRYPGGRADLERNLHLRACVDEQQQAKQAKLVTGLAGYVVMKNRVDASIDSPRVISIALESALASHDSAKLPIELRARLEDSWADRVASVALFKSQRSEVGATVWPLWVQYE
jgi:hypothetical protein